MLWLQNIHDAAAADHDDGDNDAVIVIIHVMKF